MSRLPQQTTIAIDLDETRPAPAAANTAPAPDIVEEAGPAGIVDEDGDLSGGLPKRAARNDDGSITLPLRLPVTLQIRSASGGVRSETYASLTFHRLLGGDIRAIQSASKESQAAVLLGRSARIREAVMSVLFDKMDGEDIADGAEIVMHFLGGGRKTSA